MSDENAGGLEHGKRQHENPLVHLGGNSSNVSDLVAERAVPIQKLCGMMMQQDNVDLDAHKTLAITVYDLVEKLVDDVKKLEANGQEGVSDITTSAPQ